MIKAETNGVLGSFSLKGKTALVTGGAGLYGRQIVAALAEAGATTYMAARGLEAIEKVAAQHREQGHEVYALQFDQGDEGSILDLKAQMEARAPQLDILVNNAVLRPMKLGMADTVESFAESMKVNASGLFAITRCMGDWIAESGGGSIINIGSIQGMVGPDASLYVGTGMNGFVPDYFFHKGGIINFTRYAASYWGPLNVRCNCVSAGGFFNDQPELFLDRYCERTFLGRMANDEDLKGIIVFLASDASVYVTGANIPVDGGYTAK